MQDAGYRLPGIYLPRGWVNNRPRKLGRRPELENAVPIRVRLGWLACPQPALYSRAYSRGFVARDSRLNCRLLAPLPGIPDNEYRTRHLLGNRERFFMRGSIKVLAPKVPDRGERALSPGPNA